MENLYYNKMQGSGQILFNEDKKEQPDKSAGQGGAFNQSEDTRRQDNDPTINNADATRDDLTKLEEKDPKQAARIEEQKETEKTEVKSNTKLDELVDRSNTVLMRISTVFPFTFFPIKLIINPIKIDLINTFFFESEQVHSTLISDITDVTVNTDLFFATLEIRDSGFHDQLISVPYLRKSEAMKARRVIQGLIMAMKNGIDPSKIPADELLEKAEQIGRSNRS